MDQRPRDLAFWSANLGLLPTPLFSDPTNNLLEQPRVLLNGSAGNFVLDTNDYVSRNIPERDPRILAWSSNVGSYVTVKENSVEVQRWDQWRFSLERYNLVSVTNNVERFYAYLERHTSRSELSIVAQTIKTFRNLRSALGSSESGADALLAFLYLLACAADNVDRQSLDLERWRLPAPAQAIASQISEGHWEALVMEIRRGRPREKLSNPDINLLLRHAAGQLFQEAHYEAVFLPQRWLFEDILPDSANIQSPSSRSTVHFTPAFLVRTLVEAALKADSSGGDPITVFDPACGSGEFLREALRQLRARGVQRPVRIIGWDVSEAACAMANFVLSVEQRDMPEATIEIKCLNALAGERWPTNIDIVLMNPPFMAWENLGEREKSYVVDTLGRLLGAKSDLSHAFVLKAVEALRVGGVISCVLPASFLTADSAQPIRTHLTDLVVPRLIARLGSQLLFPGALVDAACYVAIKGRDNTAQAQTSSTLAFWADVGKNSVSKGLRTMRKLNYWENPLDYPVEDIGFSIYMHPNLGKSTFQKEQSSWNPPPYSSWKLLQNSASLLTVGELFDVRRGVQTGNNHIFVLPRDRWQELPSAEQRFFRQAAVPDSIHYGDIDNTSYVFYPYAEYSISSEEELVSKLPHYYYQYLLPARDELSKRPNTKLETWWTLNRPRAWASTPKPEPHILSNQFGGEGSFALDMTGKILVINGLSWRAKKVPRESMSFKTTLSAYVAILNSSLFPKLLAATSRQLQGGQWQLAKQYVDQIPLPDFFEEQFSEHLIRDLASLGEEDAAFQSQSDTRILELLSPLYQLDQN